MQQLVRQCSTLSNVILITNVSCGRIPATNLIRRGVFLQVALSSTAKGNLYILSLQTKKQSIVARVVIVDSGERLVLGKTCLVGTSRLNVKSEICP